MAMALPIRAAPIVVVTFTITGARDPYFRDLALSAEFAVLVETMFTMPKVIVKLPRVWCLLPAKSS